MKASVLDVISAISLYAGGAIAIGFLVSWLILRKHDSLKSLFGYFTLGLTVLYILILSQVSLTAITYVLIGALVGTVLLAAWRFRIGRRLFRSSYLTYGSYALFILLSLALNWRIVERLFYEPVFQWDARIVWYLHTKQLFFANGLNNDTGIVFAHNEGIYHPGYPLLIPAIGAFVAHYVGFWNDYLPKANLFVLFLGILIALLSAKPIHWVWKIVMVVLMVGFNPYMMSVGYNPYFLTIGYMDGWLAIYAGLCLLFLLLYIRHGSKEYLFNAIATGFLLPSIKNEGLLLMLIIFGSYGLGLVIFNLRDRRYLRFALKSWIRLWPVVLLGIVPIVVWAQYKNRWNAHIKDYDFSRLTQFATYNTTFSNKKLALIHSSYTNNAFSPNYWYLYILLLASSLVYLRVIGLSSKNWRRYAQELTVSASSGLIFVGLMIVVYCLSIHDLTWHLSTSADRLGLEGYYLFSMGMVTMISALHYQPYKRVKNTPASLIVPPVMARQSTIALKSTVGKQAVSKRQKR
jgi:hypothetical protein